MCNRTLGYNPHAPCTVKKDTQLSQYISICLMKWQYEFLVSMEGGGGGEGIYYELCTHNLMYAYRPYTCHTFQSV